MYDDEIVKIKYYDDEQKPWYTQYLDENRKFSGHYNENYLIECDGCKYIVRIPKSDAEQMDLKLIPEGEILTFLDKNSFEAPRLIRFDDESSVHSFIEGDLIADIYSTVAEIPDDLLIKLAEMMKKLHSLEAKEFEKFMVGNLKRCTTSEFFRLLIKYAELTYYRIYECYKKGFSELQVPKDPFEYLKLIVDDMDQRDFCLCHCDIHAKNIILNKNGMNGMTPVLLDWELSLYGDPVYDISNHFYYMKYTEDQERLFLSHYLGLPDITAEIRDYMEQIEHYKNFAVIKSVIVDCKRYSNLLFLPQYNFEEQVIIDDYTNKINKARKIWGIRDKIYPVDILDVFDHRNQEKWWKL